MSSHIDRVTEEIKRQVLDGRLPPGTRLVELSLSAMLGVSRTPVRLALTELERQGLIERLSTRGYRVRQFAVEQVAEAIDVRGVLEGMAARLGAEAGLAADVLAELRACVALGAALIASAREPGAQLDAAAWAGMNARFHRALVGASGNSVLESTLAHVAKAPMAAAGALALHRVAPGLELAFIERAQADHGEIVEALAAREGGRAEALVREHARRSRDNKRLLIGRLLSGVPVRTSAG